LLTQRNPRSFNLIGALGTLEARGELVLEEWHRLDPAILRPLAVLLHVDRLLVVLGAIDRGEVRLVIVPEDVIEVLPGAVMWMTSSLTGASMIEDALK
jgi:hypothetical protein